MLGGFREPIVKVFRAPLPQIRVCFHASFQVIVFNIFLVYIWIPLPREGNGLHCVREPHLSDTCSSSAKTGGGFLQTWEPLLEGVDSSSVHGGGVQECWEPLSRIVFGSSAEKRGVGSLATIWDSIPP